MALPYSSCIIVFLQVGKSNSTFKLIADKWDFALLASRCCLPVCDQDVVSFIHSCMLTMIGWNMQTHSKAWAICTIITITIFSIFTKYPIINMITRYLISMMGWNTRTRSPRIQHSLASVDEEEAARRRWGKAHKTPTCSCPHMLIYPHMIMCSYAHISLISKEVAQTGDQHAHLHLPGHRRHHLLRRLLPHILLHIVRRPSIVKLS